MDLKDSRLKWIFLPTGDYLALCQWLNRLAEQGWELAETGDGSCFFARFRPTERAELRYDTEIAPILRDEDQLRETVERRERQGWSPVGTVNGVDVYVSQPCRYPEPEDDPTGNRRRWRARGVLTLVTVVLAALLSWQWSWFNATWYLGNTAALLYLSRFPLLIGGGFWAAWVLLRQLTPWKNEIRTGPAWVRSALQAAFYLWAVLLLAALVLDQLPLAWACVVLAVALAVLLLGRRGWRKWTGFAGQSLLALVVGCTLLISQLLPLALPDSQRYSAGSASWRGSLTDVVRAEDLGLDELSFVSAEYDRDGSLLVSRSTYREEWEELRLSCQYDRCLTAGLASQAAEEIRTAHPGAVIVVRGRQVVALWSPEELDEAAVQTALEELLTG
ncbi:MAG: DUF2812 domain-containing protein [Clostridiales bacterium]|nr:DUF2812 domain-containing protein [Clostridiales bacterium]